MVLLSVSKLAQALCANQPDLYRMSPIVGLNNLIGLFICYFISSILKVFILVWYGIFLAHQLGTNTGNGIKFRNGCIILLFSIF